MLIAKNKLLQIADFRLILFSRAFVTMALQIQAVIVGWHIYSLTKNPLYLGLLGLTEAVPAILGAFIAGHAVDTSRPALVFNFSLLALFFNSILLLVATLPAVQGTFSISESLILFILFLGIFISGAARSFMAPAIYSIIPRIIPRDLLSSASAFSSSSYQIAAISGPAIGGLVYGKWGAVPAFALPCGLAAIGLMLSLLFSAETKKIKSQHLREPFLNSILSGLKFTVRHKVLFPAMTLDMFSVLFGGAVAVLPMFADQVFHVGPSGLGFLRAAPSVGSMIVAVYLAFKPLKKLTGQALLTMVTAWALSTIFFGLTSHFILALVFLFLSGVFDGVSMVIRSSILQLYTPDEMRGRVTAVNSVFITSSNEIGAFESGVAAKLLGLIPSVLFGGAASLIVVGLVMFAYPEFRKTKIE